MQTSDVTSRVTRLETLACDAGWRNYHFVKLVTEDGIAGWSEYDEGFGAPGVSAAIAARKSSPGETSVTVAVATLARNSSAESTKSPRQR